MTKKVFEARITINMDTDVSADSIEIWMKHFLKPYGCEVKEVKMEKSDGQ